VSAAYTGANSSQPKNSIYKSIFLSHSWTIAGSKLKCLNASRKSQESLRHRAVQNSPPICPHSRALVCHHESVYVAFSFLRCCPSYLRSRSNRGVPGHHILWDHFVRSCSRVCQLAKKCAVKRHWTSAGETPARELVRSTLVLGRREVSASSESFRVASANQASSDWLHQF